MSLLVHIEEKGVASSGQLMVESANGKLRGSHAAGHSQKIFLGKTNDSMRVRSCRCLDNYFFSPGTVCFFSRFPLPRLL